MMKLHATALVLACALLGGSAALAQGATYVFPYEGFRYTQQDNETVFTQTNLGEHEALIESLGTTKEAVLASYIASGIVMEVIPDDGGQIAVSVADAGAFADVKDMEDLDEARRAAFLAQFADSGLYESSAYVPTTPACVRLTSSAMYASMPVYTLRYATLHLGRLYMIEQTIVGRVPEAADDARMERLLGGMKLLASASEATPAPTVMPTATPAPTPAPTVGVAEIVSREGELIVDDAPGYVNDPQLTLTGKAARSAEVTVSVDGRQLGKATAKKDGTFSLRVKLTEEGRNELTVESGEDSVVLVLRYEMPAARLEITGPEKPTFSGTNVMVRGVTEPGATVYIEGKGMNTNVKAGKNGAFSVRVFMDGESTETFSLRAKAEEHKQTTATVTLTRVLTDKEKIEAFRQKMIELEYHSLLQNPAKYAGKQFIFRGKVMDFTDYNGSPCALVCVENPSTGVWTSPVYVVLSPSDEAAAGDVLTFYLKGEGITLPADGAYTASGAEEEVPVARAVHVTKNK